MLESYKEFVLVVLNIYVLKLIFFFLENWVLNKKVEGFFLLLFNVELGNMYFLMKLIK